MAICPKCQQKSPDVLDPCPSGDGFFCIDEDEFYSHRDDGFLGREIAGRYIVQSVLGRGSMSQVYKAHQDQVDRAVALKVFRPETILGRRRGKQTTVGERKRAEERFVQEAKVLGKLTHPNCVTVYDFGVEDDRSYMYIAMEFVAGSSLRTAIRRGLKLQGVAEIVEQVLRALREAHSLNIVHRDLKPENIILGFRYASDERVIKVLDFGIAKLLRADTNQGRPGELFGTPAYMSPEQCRGDGKDVGPGSDIYALGCIFYEMVCGDLPYPAEDPREMVRLHKEAPIPEVVGRPGLEIPAAITTFIRKCLSKDIEDRFESAHEAYGAFRDVIAETELKLGPGLEGREAAEVTRADRRVVVPENRVTGTRLDPIGGESSAGTDVGASVAPPPEEAAGGAASEAFEEPRVSETVQGGPHPEAASESGDGDEGPGAERREGDGNPSPIAETNPLVGDHPVHETDEPEVGDTLASTGLETSRADGLTDDWNDKLRAAVDSQTVAVIMVVCTIAGFCVILFYFIYTAIT